MADVRAIFLLTLVLGFQASLVVLPVRAQASCTISADGLRADCQGRQLDRVPVDRLPSTVEVLDLSFNVLRIINNADFFRLPNLRVLWLQFNNISLIEEEAFQRIVRLEELSIFNNSLTAIPSRALAPLSRLQKLDLSNNLYTQATLDDVFLNFSGLNMISIGGPILSVLKKGDLDALQNTSLDKFAIKTGSSLDIYEPGYLKKLQTSVLWLDIAVDNRTHALPLILSDLKNKTFKRLRFRNLFEFTYYTDKEDLFNGLEYVNIQDLVFYRGKFSEGLMRMALVNVQKSSVKVLELFFIDFARSQPFGNNDEESTVKDLQLELLVLSDISNPDILRFDWRFTWLNNIHHLRVQNVNFNTVPCDAWEEMRGVRILDVSKNRLQDRFLFNQQCVYRNKMPSLHTLNVSNNQLSSLNSFHSLAGGFERLQIIDVSHNQLGLKGNGHCHWSQNITTVIGNHNSMVSESFKCLPVSAVYLDLSYCNLDQLEMDYFKKASNLREIHLTGNKIKFIPSDWRSPNLKSLALDGNSFGIINTKSFRGMPNLKELRAGNNPYYCTCDLHTFIQETAIKGKVHIADWPENYKCYHPEDLLNTMVSHYFPGNIACDIRLVITISVATTAGVVLALMLICYFCNIPWYAKATYQILRAKYRVHKEGLAHSMEYTFHAFISYSHSDADWVRDQLLPCLENARPPYRLCIHERDFMPGKWIIDNIIDNIENSRKIIFVLSRHFVNSEWCNYELYFAQQRVMGKTFSDVILVVKEPIDPKSLPSKYCKLKKMLSTKTYLDWPEQPKHQAFFWAQLKSVLGKPSPTDEQRRLTRLSRVSVIELPHENQGSVDVGTKVDEGTRF